LPVVISWIVAGFLLAMAALRGWGALWLFRHLPRVPPRRQRVAWFIVFSMAAVSMLGVLSAVAVLLAHYRPAAEWIGPILAAGGVALLAALPGLGMYLWRHHEPWIHEWRGTAEATSDRTT
jgi:hypothetical protein